MEIAIKGYMYFIRLKYDGTVKAHFIDKYLAALYAKYLSEYLNSDCYLYKKEVLFMNNGESCIYEHDGVSHEYEAISWEGIINGGKLSCLACEYLKNHNG